MTLLYRSPNLTIDCHEWHVTVNRETNGHVTTVYRFRPITDRRRVMWKPLAKWPGRPPKELWRFFAPYRKSVRVAMGETQHARQVRHEVGTLQRVAA